MNVQKSFIISNVACSVLEGLFTNQIRTDEQKQVMKSSILFGTDNLTKIMQKNKTKTRKSVTSDSVSTRWKFKRDCMNGKQLIKH